MTQKVFVGIDEVGRGPIAGSVVICAYVVATSMYQEFCRTAQGINDSKKLSSKKRQAWIEKTKNSGFSILKEKSAAEIDEYGISYCLTKNIEEALQEIELQGYEIEKVFLDGSLKAPEKYSQETIIKGDESQPLISMASIVAKEYRDDYMKKLGAQFPEYGFEQHMGYGTKHHYSKILENGVISTIHRLSFLAKLL
ncbi:MAG TPA: ribonuclease HII [Candidatus Paceibacterota bacterium]